MFERVLATVIESCRLLVLNSHQFFIFIEFPIRALTKKLIKASSLIILSMIVSVHVIVLDYV